MTLDCNLWKMGFRVELPRKKDTEKEEVELNPLELRELTEVEFQEISVEPGIWYPVMACWSAHEFAEVELME